MSGLVHVSLFAGVGGIDLAADDCGIPTVLACEKDDAARGVLADRFPTTTLHADVTELTSDDLYAAGAVPGRTVLSAGWPCQGNSVAGRRGGMGDARSGLWSEVARLLAEFRPAWFVGENVPGLLSVHGGRDFGAVLGDLADLGYGFAWRVLDAQHFGVPQRRSRVVIVGRAGADGAAPAQVLLEPESGGRDSAAGRASRAHPSRRARQGAGVAGPQLIPFDTTQITSGENRANPQPGDPCHPLSAKAHAPAIATALTTRAGSTFDDQQTGQLVVSALTSSHGGADDNDAQAGHLVCVTGDRTHALTSEGADASEDGAGRGSPIVAATLTAGMSRPGVSAPGRRQEDDVNLVPTETAVRRLTPLECERLQGWPDGHTATSWGKPQSDSARYRQGGNGVARPVFTWVFDRIVHAEAVAVSTGKVTRNG